MDYTPTGVLQLGQILTDFTNPNSAILTEGTAPIPEETLKDESIHRKVNFESIESQQTAFRTWLKVAFDMDKIAKVSKTLQKAYQEKFEGHNISAVMFQPSERYVQTALSLRDASPLTSMPWYMRHRRIWLVTGLRILGKGTKVSEAFIQRATGAAGAKVDCTTVEVPIAAGLDVGHQQTTFKDHEVHDSDPFIYCYRLHEIIIKRTYKKTKLKAFSGGHIQDTGQDYNSSDDEDADSDEEEVINGYEVVAVDDEAFDGAGEKASCVFVILVLEQFLNLVYCG